MDRHTHVGRKQSTYAPYVFFYVCEWDIEAQVGSNLTTVWFAIFMRDLFSCFCKSELVAKKLKPQTFHCQMWVNHFSIQQYFHYLAVLTAIAQANQIIEQRNKLEGGARLTAKAISALRRAWVWNYFILSPAVPAYGFSQYTNKEQGTKGQDYHLSPQTFLDIHSTFSHPAN